MTASASKVYPMFVVENVATTETENLDGKKISSSQKKLNFVEKELLATLSYIDEQLGEIDTKGADLEQFNRGLYEVKKMFIEQKLNLLRQISSMAHFAMKDETDNNRSDDITSLLEA